MNKKDKKLLRDFFGAGELSPVREMRIKARENSPSMHYFTIEGKRHGEFLSVHQNGNIDMHTFFIDGELFGPKYHYNHSNEAVVGSFYRNGVEVKGIPFLGRKPERLPYASRRTRIDTLEM